MTSASSTTQVLNRERRPLLKWIAGVAAAVLAAGTLVVAGVGAQKALAADPAPGVAVQPSGTYIAGEDLTLDITFTSAGSSAGDQYNLSAGIVMPKDIAVLPGGTLGTPKVFAEGAVLTGNYTNFPGDCSLLGLEPAGPGHPGNACKVPAGKQYLVFQNISDLPKGAETSHSITVRPDADVFPVGSTIDFDVTAYTSNNERLIPVFPGSTGVAEGPDHTSEPGYPGRPDTSQRTTEVTVGALRLEKSEPSAENELLRGVHANTTTYTLRVWHTGEGDLDGVVVTDFLPAGLEYLGLGGSDNTTNANGTQGGPAEYPGAASLTATPAPAPSTWEGAAHPDRNAATLGEIVSTVIPTAEEVADYGLEAGKVYTKVVWNLGELAAAGVVDYGILDPKPQDYAEGIAGAPGFVEIRYRAGIPLFENTLDFDGSGGQPASAEQIANLDNNRGASTRQGSPQTTPGTDDDGSPKSLRNVAGVTAQYAGQVADEGDRETGDTAAHAVDAMDVRVLKSVDRGAFEQGEIATYTLSIKTSEYTSADLGAGGSAGIRPNRLVDDLGDGICPILPGEKVTPGLVIPRLLLGDPRDGGAVIEDDMDPAVWSAALVASGVSGCEYPSDSASATLEGATLSGIAYDPATGHFFLDLSVAPIAANTELPVQYTAKQNSSYAENDGEPGATTSGDSIVNTVALMMTTDPIDALAGVESSGTGSTPGDTADSGLWRAEDDSSAVLQAPLSSLSKHVLKRSAGVPEGGAITDVAEDQWVKTPEENEPFSVGDEIWYRIKVTPPSGADVRNPKLTDFLPPGVRFEPVDADDDDRFDNIWILPSSTDRQLGSCPALPDTEAWLDEFVPSEGITVNGNVLTFNLGSRNCFGEPPIGPDLRDRFLPLDTQLEVYIKVTVTDAQAFAQVDLSENLAKYQQENVDGQIFFLRDQADIQLDQSVKLAKGIRYFTDGVTSAQTPSIPNPYNSDVDGGEAVQGDRVTYRLDVSAPRNATTDYVIWDALPVGVKKADLQGWDPDTGSFDTTAAIVTQQWFEYPEGHPGYPGGLWEPVEEAPDPDTHSWTARAYDPADSAELGYPSELREAYEDRTIVVWTFTGQVPGYLVEEDMGDYVKPAVAQGFTLGYTVKVPSGATGAGAAAQIGQEYVNDASIIQLDALNNSEGSGSAPKESTLIINGSDAGPHLAEKRTPSTNPVDREFAYADKSDAASDLSYFQIRGAGMAKTLHGTEVKPADDQYNSTSTSGPAAGRPDNVIVQGEYAEFDVSVTIPAHTTVRDGLLKDDGYLRWTSNSGGTPASGQLRYNLADAQVVSAPWLPGTMPGDFELDWDPADAANSTGALVFPDTYTNTGNADATFTVRLKVWIEDRDESTPGFPVNFGNAVVFTNTAKFTYTDAEDNDAALEPAQATVNYREPSPALGKTIVGGTAGADGNVTFRLSASNAANRPALYDAVVYDCLPASFTMPAGGFNFTWSQGSASVVAGGCTTTGTGASIRVQPGGGSGTLIQWNVGRLNGGAAATLDFTAKVTPSAGGGATYTNRAHILGSTLPDTVTDPGRRGDRATGVSRDVTLAPATLAKTVTPTQAPVGETVRYRLVTTIPANANFYDVGLTDTLPAGVSYAGNPTIEFVGDWSAGTPSIDAAPAQAGQVLTWPASGNADILFAATARSIAIEFDAKITNAPGLAVPSVNRSKFAWNMENGVSGSRRETAEATATVTILNPNVTVQKHVKLTGAADGTYATTRNGDPDQAFTYRVRLTNTGNTPAHHVRASDVVEPGVRIDTSQAAFAGATFSDVAALEAGLGGTITWNDLGTIGHVAPGNTLDLVYDGTLVGSADLESAASPPAAPGTGKQLDNTARVVQYTSFANDGWVYTPGGLRPGGSTVPTAGTQSTAGAIPVFPSLVPTKTVTNPVSGQSYGIAHVGENFNWKLTLRNQGAGTAEDIGVTDTLPVNWEYVGNATISVNGGPAVPLAPPVLTPATVGDGDQQVIEWSEAAIRAAGAAPLAAGGSFVITFDARPTAAALTAPGTGVIGNGVKVNPHTNTLSATATDTNGAYGNKNTPSYAGPQSQATAYIAEADLALTKTAAAQPLKAGQTNATGWTLTVRNSGPDTAEGPITVTDTTGALPAGVTVTGATGTGWSCTTPARAGDGTTAFTCSRTDPDESLASGASFPAISVAVSVAADQPATTVDNTGIVVPGSTYDPNYVADPEDPDYDAQNNRSEAPLDIVTEADLRLVKTVSSPNPVPAGGVVVGDSITWELTVTNLGPSDSQSPADDPITITDEVPAGITGVADPSSASWTATLNGDPWPAGGTATAGDQIKWSYTGAALTAGASSSVTLTGTILTSHQGDIVNAARVHPGPTTDPDYGTPTENNKSQVTTPTDDATALDVRKSRVVPDATAPDGWRQADPATHPEDAFVAGEPVHYRVTVTNLGPADARDVRVVDEVPAGLGYVTHEGLVGDWGRTAGGTTSTGTDPSWDTFALSGSHSPQPAGAANATSFVVTYDSLPTVTGNVINHVEATASNWRSSDPQRYDRDQVGTNPTRIVDLGLEKTHTGTGPFTPGTEVEYTLTVTNHGPSATSGVIAIDDTLPAGMSYVPGSAQVTVPATAPAQIDPTVGADPRELAWEVLTEADTFDLDAQITVVFRALMDPEVRIGTVLVNEAEVAGPDEEPDPETYPNRDTDTVTATGTEATMGIVKQVETEPGLWGETAEKVAGTQVKWRVTVINSGPSAAPVTFSDALPAGLSLVSMSGTGWDCPVASGVPTGTCSYVGDGDGLHPVGAANATTIEIVAKIASNVPPTATPGAALVNTGTIQWSDDVTPGVQSANDTASITVKTEADLGLVKKAVDPADDTTEVTTAIAGKQARYRIDVTNYGPSDAAPDLVVTDTLPLGVSYVGPVGATADNWQISASAYDPAVQQTVTFTRVAGVTKVGLPMAGTGPTPAPAILFDVLIDPALPSTAAPNPRVNTATVVSGTAEPAIDPHPNTDDASLTITRSADLEITKSHPTDAQGQVHVGDPLDFTIRVKNHGPSVSSGFEVIDVVPDGLEVTGVMGVDLSGLPAAVPGTPWTIELVDPVDPLDPTAGATVVATYAGTLGVGQEAEPLVISTLIHENAHCTCANHVEITDANEPDPDPDDNAWDDLLDVTPLVTLVVEKQAVGDFQVGKTGTYRITVENRGPHADPGPITVTDALPAGLSYSGSPSLPPGATVSVAGKTVTWTLANGLGVGETATLTLLVQVQQAAYPQVTNTVVVASPADLTPASVLSDDETVPVKALDPLAITGGGAVGYLAMLAALLMLAGAVAAAARGRRGAARGAHAE